MKDPDKVVSPTDNLVLIDLGMEDPGGHIPFTLLCDFPLDVGDGSAIEISVSGSPDACIFASLAHVVSCPIAPRMDWVSSSNRLPFNPRSRV